MLCLCASVCLCVHIWGVGGHICKCSETIMSHTMQMEEAAQLQHLCFLATSVNMAVSPRAVLLRATWCLRHVLDRTG